MKVPAYVPAPAHAEDATELELKARVIDPGGLRRRLIAAGAHLSFEGMMRDRRFDRGRELSRRDEVLRTRAFTPSIGTAVGGATLLAWKGPTQRSPGGYKQRRELEYTVSGHAPPAALLEALGFRVVEAIDRYVEVYELPGLVLRIEWYPRMDTLLEVEGAPDAIERGVTASGIVRAEFLPDPLAAFVARYEARTGSRAILSEDALAGDAPGWSRR